MNILLPFTVLFNEINVSRKEIIRNSKYLFTLENCEHLHINNQNTFSTFPEELYVYLLCSIQIFPENNRHIKGLFAEKNILSYTRITGTFHIFTN